MNNRRIKPAESVREYHEKARDVRDFEGELQEDVQPIEKHVRELFGSEHIHQALMICPEMKKETKQVLTQSLQAPDDRQKFSLDASVARINGCPSRG